MKVEDWDIERLIPYARNPRKNSDTVDGLAASIKGFGFQQPIVVDTENVIVVGHTRYLAAKKPGLKKVPVLVAKDLTPEQAKAYRIVDNKLQEKSKWDYELLELELSEVELDLGAFDLTFGGIVPAPVAHPDSEISDAHLSNDDGPDTMVVIGSYRFPVDRNKYLEWIEDIRQEVGFDEPAIIAEISQRLGF